MSIPIDFEEARLDGSLSWVSILDTLAAQAKSGSYREAVERLTRAVWPDLRRMAADTVMRYEPSLSRFGADAESIVATEFFSLLKECVETHLRPQSFKALLWKRVQNVFGAAYARETSPSGTVALARKRNLIKRVQSALRIELGVEPSLQQVAERANREAALRRSDPKRQGMLFTAAHVAEILAVHDFAQLDDANDRDQALGADPADDSAAITPLERKELALKVIDFVAESPAPLPRVATILWSSQLGDDPVDFPPASTIAQMVGCSPAEAQRARYKLVHVIPQQILAEHYGITSTAG